MTVSWARKEGGMNLSNRGVITNSPFDFPSQLIAVLVSLWNSVRLLSYKTLYINSLRILDVCICVYMHVAYPWMPVLKIYINP